MSIDNGTPRTYYRIRDWNQKYENAQSRPLHYLRWIASPIIFGTPDYAELVGRENGMAIFGLWKAITELGAVSQPRGSLLKSGGTPHTQESIALVLQTSKDFLQTSINLFLHLGFLEEVPFTKHGLYVPLDNHQTSKDSLQFSKDPLQKSTNNARTREQDSTGQTTTPPGPPSPEGGPPPQPTNRNRQPRGLSRAERLAARISERHQQGTL